MRQIARNLTDAQDGFLLRSRYLIHNRDPLFTKSFQEILQSSGVRPVKRRMVREYVEHYHVERNHQGIGNRLIDSSANESRNSGSIECSERLGGLLRFYRRAA